MNLESHFEDARAGQNKIMDRVVDIHQTLEPLIQKARDQHVKEREANGQLKIIAIRASAQAGLIVDFHEDFVTT